jgi:hypothetical protein
MPPWHLYSSAFICFTFSFASFFVYLAFCEFSILQLIKCLIFMKSYLSLNLQRVDYVILYVSVKMQVNAAAEVIYDLVDPTANLIFGAVIDQSLGGQVSW